VWIFGKSTGRSGGEVGRVGKGKGESARGLTRAGP